MAKRTSTHKRNSGKRAPRGYVLRTGSSGKKASSRSPQGLCEQLEQAAKGLYHVSESDYPYRFFTLPAASEPAERKDDLTAQGFLIRLGISQQFTDEFNVPIDVLATEKTLEDFFPSRETLAGYQGTDVNDPKVVSEWKQYQKLQALLKKRLRDVKVIRVGTVEIRCYIAGLDRYGNIAGLLTTCIET